jgi:hypothetical protein
MDEATVAERLETALAEQERSRLTYERAAGTGSELAAFARLQAANLRVTMCDRTYRIARPHETA